VRLTEPCRGTKSRTGETWWEEGTTDIGVAANSTCPSEPNHICILLNASWGAYATIRKPLEKVVKRATLGSGVTYSRRAFQRHPSPDRVSVRYLPIHSDRAGPLNGPITLCPLVWILAHLALLLGVWFSMVWFSFWKGQLT
jgi:hypothetical protein